jgi:Flp pilus assembly protein TadD
VNPQNADAHATLALCFAKTENSVKAEKHIPEALGLYPQSAETMFHAAVVADICGKLV